jgi:O-antigen/teichoic acid export membrane protein
VTQVPVEAAGAPPLEAVEVVQSPSLREKATRAAAWSIFGYAGGYAMRFFSTVIVTKLIAPELLGLVIVPMAVLDGLTMFTELGLQQSIIQNPRGDDPRFYNTAWTIQILRGVVLAVGTVLLSLPLAIAYHEKAYLGLIPVIGSTALVLGFMSMSMFLLRRHLAMGKVVMLELISNAAGTAVTILVGWATGSFWAVPIGMLANCGMQTFVSHMLLPGVGMKLVWDRDAVRAIVHFGKWIFLSAAVMYISRSADKFWLAKLLGSGANEKEGMARLQVYYIAMMLSEVALGLGTQITYNVLFPAYSRVVPQGIERLRNVYYRSRLRLDVLCVMATGGVAAAAPWIVALLYDDRYLGFPEAKTLGALAPYVAASDARWMLRALSVRAAMWCVLVPCESLLFGLGFSKYSFWRNVARAVWVAAGVPIGWRLGGITGVIAVMAATELPVLFVLWPAAIRHKVFSWSGELRSVAFFAVGFVLGLVFLHVMPEVRLGPILHHVAEVLHLAKPK